jgi:cytochrome P450
MDPPEQTRLRRLVAPAFTLERTQRLGPRIERVTEALLESMAAAGPPADLLARLAKPLPIIALLALLGVAQEDLDSMRASIEVMTSFGAEPPEAMMAARQGVDRHLAELIERRLAQPADDLLTDMVHVRDGDDRLGEGELIAFVHDLLGAGTQPVTAEIVHAVLAALRQPHRFRALHDDPALVPVAVEELLRYSQSADGGLGSLRLATDDVELGHVIVRAGEAVIASINAANFDETVFADPEALDVGRTPNPHLAFGDGIHHCVGIHIGRAELQAALAGLARRFPKLRLTIPENELAWNAGIAFRTPKALFVEW